MEKKRVGVGVGVMLFRDGKVLLGKRSDFADKAGSALKGEGTWTFPGGGLEAGETFEDAARREVLEETGITVKSIRVIALNNDIKENIHFVTIGLFSDDFEGEARMMEPDVISDWQWFDLEKLPSPLYFPTAKILTNYKKNTVYLAE